MNSLIEPENDHVSGVSIASPLILANYHSATVHPVPITSYRTKSSCEEDYLDFGGSGIYLESQKDGNVKVLNLKNSAINSSPFYPKTCSLPIKFVSKLDESRIGKVGSFRSSGDANEPRKLIDSSFNMITYDKASQIIFLVGKNRGQIEAYCFGKESHDVEKLNKLGSYSFEENSILPCEISESLMLEDKMLLTLRRKKYINMVKFDKEDGFKDELLINLSRIMSNPKKESYFWKVNPLSKLKHQLAIGISDLDNHTEIIDYNFVARKKTWKMDHGLVDGGDYCKKPIGLYWVKNHPRLLAYCSEYEFGIHDVRIKAQDSYRSVIKRSDCNFARLWERFRNVHHLPLNPDQHIIVMEHKAFLVDVRYPQQNLLQWNHMLNFNLPSIQRHLVIELIGNEVNPMNLISIANRNEICLITVKKTEKDIVQPFSLHHPMHASRPVDCWNFSLCNDLEFKKRLDSSEIAGITIIPQTFGYSILQLSCYGDIFVQDFYSKDNLDETDTPWTWTSKGAPSDAFIDIESAELLNGCYEKWKSHYRPDPDEDINLKDIGITFRSNRSSNHTSLSPSPSTSSLNTPSSSHSVQSIIAGEYTDANKLTKMMQLLDQEQMPNWSEYTKKILEKWT